MDYKEKLRLAKEALESGSYDKETIEYIFPELAESEDERMKEAIIATIHLYYGEPLEDEAKEMIAWLEKQGKKTEQNPKWKGVKDLEAAILAAHPTFKQKPDDKVDQHSLPVSDDSSLPTFDESIYHPCTEKVHEHKSSWSEEDELHIRELEGLVKQVWAKAEHENDKDTIHKMSDLSFFLKTLKPQAKQEWSEEDKSHIRYLIECLEHCKKGVALTMTTSTSQEYINWLKALRPQKQDVMSVDEFRHIISYLVQDVVANEHMPEEEKQPTKFFVEKYYNKLSSQSHWKPSNEQMEYLAKAILTLGNEGDCKTASILNELRTDLKKLREEQV